NDVKAVKALLGKGANPNQKSRDGEPVLIDAASRGYTEAALALLARGAAIDARGRSGITVLIAASMGGSAPIVRALTEKSADRKAAERIERSGRLKTLHGDGPSILDYAKRLSTPEIIELLKKAGAKE